MFTGLVRELGSVASYEDGRLTVDAPETARDAREGDSVAISGVCLTVVGIAGARLSFDAVPETLARTSLGSLPPGRRVNVEPALRAGDPLGGHYVQGHVDGVGEIVGVEAEGDGRRVRVRPPADLMRYLVEKGSIAVDGTSLTVAAVDGESFAVALIPHTIDATTLGDLNPGDAVNLEADVLAKYVERLLPR